MRGKSRHRTEPVLWLLFSSGGMVAALAVPVLLLLFGVVYPLGWISPPDHADLHALAANWITRLVLLGLCVLALFHWAHRFRYTLYEGLQLKHIGPVIGAVCYAGVLAGCVAAGYLLLVAL
jgi:fumarate reductase subunit D